MSFINRLFKAGAVTPAALVASAFIAFIAIFGISVIPNKDTSSISLYITPEKKVVPINELFEVEIKVKSDVPVNVFAGELKFDHDVLTIRSIDYNTSIADLWAEEPWYSNGDGTLNFTGGTTKQGGFKGDDTLIRVSFETIKSSEGTITLNNPRILLHDGLGTDAALNETIDTFIVVNGEKLQDNVNMSESDSKTDYKIVETPPSTDLNNDGKQSIADISIFMINIASDNIRYDFNLDGEVNIKDLNILLDAK